MSLLQNAAVLLILLVIAFAIAGFSFLWYDFLATREALVRRVDALLPPRRSVPAGGKKTAGEGVFRAPLAAAASRNTAEIARRLARLGVPVNRATIVFAAFRLALGALLAAGLSIIVFSLRAPASLLQPLGLVVVGIALGWFAPALVITMLARRRVRAIELGLPDAIELLVIAVEAGLALEDGIDRITAELRRSQPAFAEELALTSADLKILPSRELALSNLAKRVDVPSVRAVVTTLSQTLRYGTPLAQALRVVAAELRNDALIRLEERANRMPVLLTIPMVLFILPSVFLTVGGPAFLRLLDVLSHR